MGKQIIWTATYRSCAGKKIDLSVEATDQDAAKKRLKIAICKKHAGHRFRMIDGPRKAK